MSKQNRTLQELQLLQALPLEIKIKKTENRLLEYYNYFDGNVYLSFSGGKDSTVLKHIIENNSRLAGIDVVFCDTGLEYPEVRQFARSFDNVKVVRPTMTFKQVLETYGYPIISKEVARRVQYAKKAIAEGRESAHGDYRKLCGLAVDKDGQKSQFNCEKWKFLLDAPFDCSNSCCTVMKKSPLKKYERESKNVPITATMAEESRMRKEAWIRNGCNAFDSNRPMSSPMSFWTEQDVLQYIKENNIEIASVYGTIETDENGKLYTTGCNRTGCVFCGFGCHLEKPMNRFQRLEKTHPKLYNYCIYGGEYIDGKWKPSKDGLGLGKVLDYIGVDYKYNPDKDFVQLKLF